MEELSADNVLQLLEMALSAENSKQFLAGKLIIDEIIINFLKDHRICYLNNSAESKYSCQLFYLISKALKEKDPESLNTNQINFIAHGVQECAQNSLEIHIKRQPNKTTYNTTDQINEELISSVRMFQHFFTHKFIVDNTFDEIKLDYSIAVISVVAMRKEELAILKNLPQQIGTELYFKFLMMIKGFTGFSKNFQMIVHNELMRLIRFENGYLLLCQNLLVKSEVPLWQRCNMISKIVEAASTKNKEIATKVIEKVFETLNLSLIKCDNELTGACVVVLKNLEEKGEASFIHEKILNPLEKLKNPEVTLCGSILMENQELKIFVDILSALFSTSTITSMPSKILQPSINSLFGLYSILPEMTEKEKLAKVLIFTLNNIDKGVLPTIMKNLLPSSIHQRITYKNNSLQIGNDENSNINFEAFIFLVRNSNNNLLIYNIFLCLISLFSDAQNSSKSFLTSYDLDEDELPEVLHKKFFQQLSLIEALQEMIQWKSLHSQLNDNPREIISAIKGILEKSSEKDEQIAIIFFSLFKEMLNKVRCDEQRREMKRDVKRLAEKFKNKEQIILMFNEEEVGNVDPSKIVFDDAMKLLQAPEIYCKVYGSDTLIKLLKKRDKQTLINRHTILATALRNMNESESYAYLNNIRLLVALTNVMDVEVIDALVAEYQNTELVVDERLKFGEVIVKVTENLGEMASKFKQNLINCFLWGARDDCDEFRTSSLANLGTICKILSYQIHNFFHEMFLQLEGIIRSDTYLPSKRAAASVLSQILAGLPNLLDFQEFLLPIYHLLKEILANESDVQTRIHAEIALEHLNEKTKDFLNPKLKAEKEIKIRLHENPHEIKEIKYK